MTNIIKFPKSKGIAIPRAPTSAESVNSNGAKGKVLFAGLVKVIWFAVVLVWPILKWVLSIEVFFQMLRMFYHWNTPGIHAGWTFMLHFAVLSALTYFVAFYNPINRG
jgi:hypothetical protein